MTQTIEPRFLTAVAGQHPIIMCEKHARVFESAMTFGDIPHTIIELDDEDAPEHCHACDLVVAKAYAKRVEEAQNAPRIILPGNIQ